MYARCTRRYSTDRVPIKHGFSPMYAEIKYRSRTDNVQSRERTGKGNRFAEQGIVADLGSGTMGRRDHKPEDKINSMAGEFLELSKMATPTSGACGQREKVRPPTLVQVLLLLFFNPSSNLLSIRVRTCRQRLPGLLLRF